MSRQIYYPYDLKSIYIMGPYINMISIHSYIRIYRYIRLNRSYIIYHNDAYIPIEQI